MRQSRLDLSPDLGFFGRPSEFLPENMRADPRILRGAEELKKMAARALEEGDAVGFLCCAPNTLGLWIVGANIGPLKAHGIYETALLHAFSSTRTNNYRYPLAQLRRLFGLADRARLRAAGDPLPGPGPFTLYRGISGTGRARRIRGLSWTSDKDEACWFATRPLCSYDSPAVFRGEFGAEAVLAYLDDRDEREFVVSVGKARTSRIPLSEPEIETRGQEIQRRREEDNQRWLAKARLRLAQKGSGSKAGGEGR